MKTAFAPKFLQFLLLPLFVFVLNVGWGQTSYTSASVTTAWNASRWNNSSDASPYTSAFTSNNAASFTSGTYTFAGMGAAINVGNVTVASNVTVNFASIGSTFSTNGAVRTFDIGSGGLFDFNGQAISTAAGTGFIKTGAGVFAISGSTFPGGFTLNAGTVIARSTTALGSGTGNILTLNGGTIASNATRDFASTRFPGGIVIGGNIQFGEVASNVALADPAANLSFANATSLGAATRTITIGGTGTYTLGGVISGATGSGLTINTNSTGNITLTAVNTYTGNTTINGNLILSGSGSIATSPIITIGSGGTFGVTGLTTALALGSTQTLKASATGSNTTGTITVASTKGITLGSTGGLQFTAYGGGATAPLTIAGASASLALNSAPITVTTTTALEAGTYKLIAKGGSVTAAISGTIGTLTMAGSGIAAGTAASLSIVNGELILTVASTTPTITASGTLSAVNTTYGTASASPTSFNVSGANMSEGILVTPPAGYEVCLTSNGTYTSTVTVGSSGTISSTTVYVRLAAATEVGAYSGNIVLSSTSATSVNVATVSSAVSKKALTITGLNGVNKTYDGLTTASSEGTAVYSGLISGESFAVTGTPSFSFSTATVEDGKTITVTGYTAPSTNYSITQPSLTANISRAVLTITAANQTVSYGTAATAVTGAGTYLPTGFVNNETSSVISGTATYSTTYTNTTAVGTSSVTITPVVTNLIATNYSFSAENGSITIIKANSSISVSGTNSFIYDGNPQGPASSSVTGSTGGVTYSYSGTLSTIYAESPTAPTEVGTYQVIASVASDENYNAAISSAFAFNITSGAVPEINGLLTASATYGVEATAYTVTGTNNPTSFSASNLPAGLTINTTTGEITGTPTAVPASYNVTIGATNAGGTGTAVLVYTISKKALDITNPAASNKEYDRTNAALITGSLSGIVGSDDVTLNGTGTFSSANTGTGITVTSTSTLGGAHAGNYTLTQPSGLTADITAKPLTVSGATAVNRAYTGLASAAITGATLVGVIAPDAVTVNGSGTFANIDVANGISVTAALILDGANAGNYTLTQPTGLTANITPANLTIEGLTGTNKVYDGLTTATATGTAAYAGLVNGETYTVSGTPVLNFTNASVGNLKTISVIGYEAPSGNYSVTPPTLSANITPAVLTITGLTGVNKIYNGTTTATVAGTASYVGLQNGEIADVSGTPIFNFSDANVGTGKTITVTGYTNPNANYTITQPSGLTADINKADQTITFNVLAAQTTATVIDYSPGATSATSGLNAITYTSSNSAVATIVGGLIHIVGAGTTTITASQATSTNYNAATSVSQNLVVTLAPVVLAGWNVSGLTGGTNNFGPSPLTPTTTNSNTTIGGLTRGSGVGTTAAGAARAWGGVSFDNAGVASTSADNVAANKFVYFTLKPKTGYMASLNSISKFDYRRSGSGTSSGLIQYQVNSSAFVDITTVSFASSANAGASISPVNLSAISDLQNIPETSTITFRIIPFGATSSTGTFYIFDVSNTTANDFEITGTVSIPATPPTLTADATANTVDNNIDITFTDDASWRGAITAVKIGATSLTLTTDYTISAGNIQLKPSGLNALLTTSGSKDLTVIATGYSNATVTQLIEAGTPTTNSTASISSILAPGNTRTITCTAKDQYSNLVSGYTFKYDATIVADNANTVESYVIADATTVASVNDVNLTATTSTSGVAIFTVVMPSVLDESDGISVQVQLANGSTDIGSAFAYHELPGQSITFNELSAVTYGDAAFTGAATGGASGNPVVFTSSNNAVATCTGTNGSTITIVGAGTASISANQAGNAGYNAAAPVSRTLTVNQKALTISGITGVTRPYNGTTAATFTGTPVYVGLVNGENFAVSGTATATFSDANAGAGKTITVTGYAGPSANYSLTQPTLTADITQATQTIIFSSLPNRAVGGASYSLNSTASSGLPITYESSNSNVVSVSGNTLTIVGAGSAIISASQIGNDNYSAATIVSQTQTIIALPIAAWDFYGQTSPATFAATTFNSNLDGNSGLKNITRGAGATSNSASNSFSSAGFKNDGISASNTDYFQVTLKANAGYALSLSEINANFDGTASYYATPGVTSQYAYSLDGTNFTLIGDPVTSTSLKPEPVVLTGVSALQNVSSSATVTIRYYASGQTTTGGWRFYSPALGVPGLAIGGSLSCAIPSAPVAGNNARCGAGTVEISATPGAGETIDWYSEVTDGTLLASGSATYTASSISSTTSYYAEARNTTTGCVSSTRTAVTASVNPLLTASVSISASATTICSGTSVTFTATPTNGGDSPSYVWKKNNSIMLGETASTYSSTSLVNGDVITCEMTSNSTSCLVASSVNSNGVTMVVNALPTASISASGSTTFCAGGNVTLTAGTSDSYSWSNNATAASINVSASGTYSVTVTNANDCAATASIVVTEWTAPTAGSTATSIMCNGGTATVTVTGTGGTGSYTGTGNFTVSAGTHTYTVTDANGCTANTSITVTEPALVNAPTGTASQTFCSTLNSTLASINVSGTAVQWYEANTSGSALASNTPLVTGTTYYATQTIAGCQSSSYLSVAVTIPVASMYYLDADADGFGDADFSQLGCTQPSGYVLNNTDCRDAVATTHPGATELCNGFDDNCNGVIDEGCAPSNACPGDFSSDGTINIDDFLVFLPFFGTSCNACPTDLNSDGTINIDDFLLFLPLFGTSCN